MLFPTDVYFETNKRDNVTSGVRRWSACEDYSIISPQFVIIRVWLIVLSLFFPITRVSSSYITHTHTHRGGGVTKLNK
ncbi:hypothetical protein [Heliothis virescens ascovirus 3h]|uniref:Uncharacterized protein n=1 Tax=Heliothis virescens ascovirus 3h TaxID=1268039 RepID=A0A386JB44_9VIRU|nr:hypothetical protein [Heliothis virescens ascovirus 3h]